MAARRRSHKRNDLPPNLYERCGYYSYRDPRSGKEFGLGRSKIFAVNEAVSANMEVLASKNERLIDRINGKNLILFDELVINFREEIERRKLKPNTMKRHNHRLKIISEHFAGVAVKNISVREVYNFLEQRSSGGRFAIANQFRTLLSDVFKCSIAAGLTNEDPVAATRAFRTEVKRSRFLLDEYLQIRRAADQSREWFALCLDLALVTGQREGDLASMRWSDIENDKLCVVQEKTGARIRISLSTRIEKLDLCLKDVLDGLRKVNGCFEKILGGKAARTIAAQFRLARDLSGLEWEGDPPPFHEIRSLSGRIYAKEKGNDYTQAILGHKSSAMTDKYRDGRGRDWKDI